ncbi:hypothetical protein [Candidatus Chloroploca sp. Khr17]|uniref:hypothetical protein n=1 Tax=Candidatus Chloroploca sp. Khr17 TaxID=2496869 RepID=UPI00101D1985|nr:hypothetical protein [Candidatus Chloroploca sp. Khr17]
MTLLRRIFAGVLFVLALLTFLLAATGTIGAWIAKATIDETTLAMVDVVTDYLDLAIQTIDTLDSNVAEAEERLGLVQTSLAFLRTERANGPVAQQMQQVITEELQPALEQLTTRAQRLREGLERFNQRIEQLNQLPFLDVPTLTNALTTLDSEITAARDQTRLVRTAIETRDNVLLQSATDRLEERLSQVRATLAEGRNRTSTVQLALIDIRQALTFWSTVSTTTISALLVLFALGQLSLAAHAWGWMFGRQREGQSTRPARRR